ncbi:MAG: family 1 encapsulin nanocompartment shell protein [Candidatus Bipolaricaulaceae bacterium]
MANKYLARGDAPLAPESWAALDQAVIEAAKGVLAGRRLLEVEGPYGLGLKAVPLPDVEDDEGLVSGAVVPVSTVRAGFTLAKRDLAAHERDGVPLDTTPAVQAARTCARREDELIFWGTQAAPGLLTAAGAAEQPLAAWDAPGEAAEDIIRAISALDRAGFHGPYALALAPDRYNRLLRLYPRGNRTELEHLQTVVQDGVHKAPVLESGGVLLAVGRPTGAIVLGQDLSVGFIGPAGDRLEFTVSETLALVLRQPAAVCVLK